jgi:hypothetical protein
METCHKSLRGRAANPVFRLAAFIGLALLLTSSPDVTAAPVTANQTPDLSTTVRSGDSWSVLRGRMFTTEALKRANPGIARQGLQPGDVVRAPYIPVSRLDDANKRIAETERKLGEARASQAEMKERVAALESIERRLAEAERARAAVQSMSFALTTAVIVLSAALLAALYFMVAARRGARLATRDLTRAERRYAKLHRSLQDLDVDLQRRIMRLISLQGVRVVSQAEVDASMSPLLDISAELKKKQAS